MSQSGATRPIDIAVMLDAFPDREDIRVGRHHMIVDLDTAPDLEPASRASVTQGRMPTAMMTRLAGSRARP